MWEPCRLQATEVSHWYSFLRTATHLLLKASCTLELVTDLFWFLHTNLTMGKAAGVAELSVMFGTFQFVYCQPSTLGFPSNWLALLFANEKVIKKTHNYLSMYLSLTCMYQLLGWPCLKKNSTRFAAAFLTLTWSQPLAAPHLLPPPPPRVWGSPAMARSQPQKPLGTASHN